MYVYIYIYIVALYIAPCVLNYNLPTRSDLAVPIRSRFSFSTGSPLPRESGSQSWASNRFPAANRSWTTIQFPIYHTTSHRQSSGDSRSQHSRASRASSCTAGSRAAPTRPAPPARVRPGERKVHEAQCHHPSPLPPRRPASRPCTPPRCSYSPSRRGASVLSLASSR